MNERKMTTLKTFWLCTLFKKLPDRESNPGRPRDRREYSPLYYRGDVHGRIDVKIIRPAFPSSVRFHVLCMMGCAYNRNVLFTCQLAFQHLLDSIVVSIPACHAGDQGTIPCRGAFWNLASTFMTGVKRRLNFFHLCFFVAKPQKKQV